MKKLLILTCMMFGFLFTAHAQDAPITAQERATNLSNEMIRDLGLNNYQSRKVKEINLDKAAKMLAIETKYAGNQAKIDELCQGVCSERDQQLENVLSTVQYNEYFGDRKIYNALDKEFVANARRGDGIKGSGVASNSATPAANTVTVN